MEVDSFEGSAAMKDRLNACMAEGLEVVSCRLLPIPRNRPWRCWRRPTIWYSQKGTWLSRLGGGPSAFLGKPSVMVVKKTKKSERETDIRPLVYDFQRREDGMFLKLACGSGGKFKPELLLEALLRRLERVGALRLPDHRLELTPGRTMSFSPGFLRRGASVRAVFVTGLGRFLLAAERKTADHGAFSPRIQGKPPWWAAFMWAV